MAKHRRTFLCGGVPYDTGNFQVDFPENSLMVLFSDSILSSS